MRESTRTRRRFLQSGATVVAGATSLAAAGQASAQSEYGGYLDDVGNFDGTVADETGADRVTIQVGADGNGGPYAFDPPAVRVTSGTAVVWEWVADYHNVVDEDGAFESEMTDEVGHTFEHAIESPGVIQYYCGPHEAMGMKGVLGVVEEAAGDTGDAGGDGSGGDDGSQTDGGTGSGRGLDSAGGSRDSLGAAIPSILALAFVIPAAYAALTGDERNDGE